jgi:osmotically inducible protein OsmC
MAAVRHAETTWHGDLTSGSGTVDYVSSGAFSRMPVSWAARTEAHGGKTSPEELIAAAHASCFSMALSARLGKNGTPAETLKVKAVVTFDKLDAGWKIVSSALTVHGTIPGIDLDAFRALAEDAKDNCPVSVALRGNVELSVEATLAA